MRFSAGESQNERAKKRHKKVEILARALRFSLLSVTGKEGRTFVLLNFVPLFD